MRDIDRLRVVWAYYFTLTALSGIGFVLSMLGILLGWGIGKDITPLLITFVVSTLGCAVSLYKLLEKDKELKELSKWLKKEKVLNEAVGNAPNKKKRKA